MIDLKSLQNFDWRSLQRYFEPKAADDLNAFLEKMPQTVGQTMLVIAGVVWVGAGAAGLFATVQLKQLAEVRAELEEVQALKPIVPNLSEVTVSQKDVAVFAESMAEIYDGVDIQSSGTTISINAKSTAEFGRFREAVGHVQNGGSGWRVNVDRLCVGRECGNNPLAASLKINKVTVDRPG